VAGFVGRSNWLPGRVEQVQRDGARVRLLLAAPEAGDRPVVWSAHGDGLQEGQRVELMVRPEALKLGDPGGLDHALEGRVASVRYGGATSQVTVETAGGERLEALARAPLPLGRRVAVSLDRDAPAPRAFVAPGQGMPRR
jgi:ABC-type Fe3+/spermidine/putrescine transport system ATPase subunit